MPESDIILLSFVNTKLRDEYPTLAAFCEDAEADEEELCARLAALGYYYDKARNAFIRS